MTDIGVSNTEVVSNVREKNLEELRKKFGNFKELSPYKVVFDDGKVVFTDSNGRESGRLASFRLHDITLNRRFMNQSIGNAFLNLERYIRKDGNSMNEISVMLSDVKNKNYYHITIPVGELMLLAVLRDMLPDGYSYKDLYKNKLRELRLGKDNNGKEKSLLLTDRFIYMLNEKFNGDVTSGNLVEKLVKQRKEKKKEERSKRKEKAEDIKTKLQMNKLKDEIMEL